jgi:glycosyltransferase involved in cell wall biosynthesis
MRFHCVTPCLNANDLITETMRSVLSQTILAQPDCFLTYIIRDGGSTDGTLDVVSRVVSEYRMCENIDIRVHSESDSGMYDALAKGLECETNSEVYSYINAGDYYSRHAFEIVFDVFSRNEVYFLTGMNAWYNEPGHLVNFHLPTDYDRDLLLCGLYGSVLPYIQQESTFWHRMVHSAVDYEMLRSFRYAGDYYLWRTFIAKTPLYVISAWLGGFRSHDGQLSRVAIDKYKAEVRNMSNSPGATDYLKAYYQRVLRMLPNRAKTRLCNRIFTYSRNRGGYSLKRDHS